MTPTLKGHIMARITLEVEVDLDAVPGAFHTPESAAHFVEIVLQTHLGHYNPKVTLPTK